MKSPRTFLALLSAALVFALAVPAQAQNRDSTRRSDQNPDRRERDFQVDGRNERTYQLDQRFRALGDEQFRIQGDIRATLNVREDDGGDVHIEGRADGSDLVVTRLQDNQEFRLTGVQEVNATIPDARQRESNRFQTVLDFNAVSRGSEPDYRVRLTVAGRVGRGGTVNAEVTSIDLERRDGGNGNGGNGGNDDDDPRFERDFEVDGRNAHTYRLDQRFRALGDQAFHIRGDLRATLNVREDRNDDVHIEGRADGSDLVVTRLEDDQAFRLVGAQEVDVTIPNARDRESNEFRTVLDFNAVAQGSEPDYRVRLTVTGRVGRDGTVQAEVTGVDLDRR